MTSWVVADASIFFAAAFKETHTAKAGALLTEWRRQNVEIAAPMLFHYEIISITRKSVHRQRLTEKEAIEGREFMLQYPVQLMMDTDLLRRAYDLATQFNRPSAYDAQYLAVAERLACEFWTADERLFNATAPHLSWVKWLGGFAP